MYTAHLTAVLILILFSFVYIRFGYKEDDYKLISLARIAFLCFVGWLIGHIVAFFLPTNRIEKTETVEIVTLQDGDGISGGFFLGSGSMNGTMKYTFYYKSDGGYRMRQIRYDEVLIKYDEKPRVETIRSIPSKKGNDWSHCIFCSHHVETIIYVPKGTIKSNYTLDAE